MTVTPLSPAQHEKARDFESLILQQFAVIGQRAVANALNLSDATVSRMKIEQVATISQLLAVLELKVVPDDHVTACPKYLQAVETLAALGLKHESAKPQE